MKRTSIEQGEDVESTLFETKIKILHGVILSNQQLMHTQTQQILTLKKQLQSERQRIRRMLQSESSGEKKILGIPINNKATINLGNKDKHIPTNNNIVTINTARITCKQCSIRISQLEQELVATKLKLAQQFSNSLQQHITIQSLQKQHLLLSQQIEMYSNKSQVDNILDGNDSQQYTCTNIETCPYGEQKQNIELINKINIGQWINSVGEGYNQDPSQLNNFNQNTYFKSSQSQSTNKLWSKHIEKQLKKLYKHNLLLSPSHLSIFHSPFFPNNDIDKHTFCKITFPLMLKCHGVPLQLRAAVWPLLINDKLALTQSLYQKLYQKSLQQYGTEPSVREQIRKDIVRSFNGQSSLNNLFKIYSKTHQLSNNLPSLNSMHQQNQSKQQCNQSPQQYNQKKQQQNQQEQQNNQHSSNINKDNIQQQSQQIGVQLTFVRKQTMETSETEIVDGGSMIQVSEDLNSLSLQQQTSLQTKNIQANPQSKQEVFPIQQLATRTLQVFSLYRPDIGFIQGMTYPTIILTLVLQQHDVFRVLANVLLTRQFFLKMITVEEGFVDAICRVFEEMLYERNGRLYDRLIRQLGVKSQVYVVDWFWTFYSRNLSPTSILKIWDLILYHYSICSPHPQLILFQEALTILQLLSPILHQTNYQESIRTIREYWRKIDENEMIEKLYDEIHKWEELERLYRRSFQKMGRKLKARGNKRD